MGFLVMFVVLLFTWLPGLGAQPTQDARALDALLQDYAFRAFVRPRPKTGIPYSGVVPSDLTGIRITAMRLRNGSLRRKGVKMYNEFQIPTGVIVRPYVKRLVLVYQNLGNWSVTYYPLANYTYLAPVLGLLAYNASNLLATNLPVLRMRASGLPINISFPAVKPPPSGSMAKCVSFDLNGSVRFSNVSGNLCSTVQQGHFSIVALAPISPPPSGAPSPSPIPIERGKKHKSRRAWIIVGSVLGGLLLLVLLSFLVVWAQKLKQRKKMQQMEKAAEVGEPLQMTLVGETKAPAAMVTRTQPTLETEYVP